MKAEVLNGTVEVGDVIAIGTRDGNSGGIRLAGITEIIPYEATRSEWSGERWERIPYTAYKLKAALIKSSDYGQVGKVNTYSELDRIVKVSSV